jgi:hypothetical protein
MDLFAQEINFNTNDSLFDQVPSWGNDEDLRLGDEGMDLPEPVDSGISFVTLNSNKDTGSLDQNQRKRKSKSKYLATLT